MSVMLNGKRVCDHCLQRPAAFLCKHPETSLHWRCLGCFRDHAREAPLVVLGVAAEPKRREVAHMVGLEKLHAAAWLLQDTWRSARTTWRVVLHPCSEAPPVTAPGVMLGLGPWGGEA